MKLEYALAFLISLSLFAAPRVYAQGHFGDPDEPEIIEVEVDGEVELQYEVPEAPEYEISAPYEHEPQYAPQRPRRPRLVRLPYHEGMEIPPGGQVIKRRRLGLIIPGAVIFAVPYIITVGTWASHPEGTGRPRVSGTALIPGFGPFIAMAQVDRGAYEFPGMLRAGLAFSGIFQIVGITMMSFGFVGKRYLVYYADVNDRRVAFQLAPIATRGGGGGGLTISF